MNKNREIYKDGEIDLVRLMGRIWKGFAAGVKAILELLAKFIVLLFRNWKKLGLAALAAILLALFTGLFTDDNYYREIFLSNNATDNSELINHINRLNGFINTGNTSSLADELNITEDQAKSVSRAEAFWIIDINGDRIPDYIDSRNRHNLYDTIDVRMTDRVALIIETRSLDIFDHITEKIIDYINHDESFRLKNNIRLSNINELIETYEYEIELLDSIQKVLLKRNDMQPGATSGQIVLLENQEIQLLHGDINMLLERKQRLVSEKEIYSDPVTVINRPGAVEKISGFGHDIKILLPAALGIVILLLIYSRLKESIRRLAGKYS